MFTLVNLGREFDGLDESLPGALGPIKKQVDQSGGTPFASLRDMPHLAELEQVVAGNLSKLRGLIPGYPLQASSGTRWRELRAGVVIHN